MKSVGPIQTQDYTRVTFTQFNQSARLRLFRRICIYLVLPFIYPGILIARASDYWFRTVSESLSVIPFLFGTIVREAFYKRTLRSCGDNISIGFGSIFFFKDISVGDNVLAGLYCTIYHADIGSNVLIGDGCRLLSGSRQHNCERCDVPITMQHGWMKKIKIGSDVWIGANAVIMDDVEEGSVVGAGSVVTKKIEKYSICAGNPARILRKRK